MPDGRPGIAACLLDGTLRIVGLVVTGMLGICLAVPFAGDISDAQADQQSTQAAGAHPCATATTRCTGTVHLPDATTGIMFHWLPRSGALGQTVLTTAATPPPDLASRYNVLLVEPRNRPSDSDVAADLEAVRTALRIDRVILYNAPGGSPGVYAYAERYADQVIGIVG